MADKPRTRRPTEDEVRAYLHDHPDAMGAQVQKAFPGLLLTEARELVSKIRREWAQDPKALPSLRDPEPLPPKPPPAPKNSAGTTPAERLSPEHRKDLQEAVTDLHRAIRLHAARIRKAAEQQAENEDGNGGLDKDETQALANLQKIAAGLVDTYPGLIAIEEMSSDGKPVQNVTESDRSIVGDVLARKAKAG